MAILDAAETFSHLAKPRIACVAASCVKVRNRNARCSVCMDVCPTQALTIRNNIIEFHDERCCGCGACASVCPTQALKTTAPSTQKIAASIEVLIEQRQDSPISPQQPLLVFCEYAYMRLAKEFDVDNLDLSHQPFLVIPCLAYLDESLYIQGFTQDYTWMLVSNVCDSCPCNQNNVIANLIEQTHRIGIGAQCNQPIERYYPKDFAHIYAFLKNQNAHATNSHISSARTPLDLEAHSILRCNFTENAPDISRRGFLSSLIEQTNEAIAHAAAETLNATVYTQSQKDTPKPTLARVLTTTPGKLKQTTPERIDRLLNCLFDRYEKYVAEQLTNQRSNTHNEVLPPLLTTPFSSRIFSHIHVLDSCNGCGMCATFCPTGALQSNSVQETCKHQSNLRTTLTPHLSTQTLSFRCNDCVSCNLCLDICPRDALYLDAHVTLEDLFSLERITVFDPPLSL